MRRTEYKIDSFTDYTGKERKFIMAAVSMMDDNFVSIKEDGHHIDTDNKILSIGISVCRPNDEFDEVIGKRISEGKAIKYRSHAIYTTDSGLINEIMVKALLEQEAEYFKVNPGRYLAGYNKDAIKYRESERIENYIDNLEEDAQAALKYITSLKAEEDIQNFVEALNYVK